MRRIIELRPDVVVLPLLSRRGLMEPGGLDAWSRAITRTVKRLTATTRVVVLGDDPHVGFDVPQCLATTKNPSRCSVSLASAILTERLEMEMAATESAAGEWYDISQWFCADSGCPAVAGSFVTRRDDNHATASFMAHIWPRLDPIMAPFAVHETP